MALWHLPMSDAFAFDYVSCKRPSGSEPTMAPWFAFGAPRSTRARVRVCARLFRPQESRDFEKLLKSLSRPRTWLKLREGEPSVQFWAVLRVPYAPIFSRTKDVNSEVRLRALRSVSALIFITAMQMRQILTLFEDRLHTSGRVHAIRMNTLAV